ncbi:MAG: MFS transporter [Erysipelotrichaceae bacterium]|nr:MFS transporter [Erysipelotrichaceae bacterium]
MSKSKKSIFDSPLLSSKVKSAKPKLFPEGILGYFAGPTLALIANAFLASYLNKYLTDIFGITAWAALFNTLLPVVSVALVVLGNIVVGKLMDKSKFKAGKARPLILFSLPASLIALVMLFIVTPLASATSDSGTQVLACVLLAVGYNLWFAVAYPLYFTPHSSLVNLSTRNGKDRSLLATLSNACNLASIGLCTMIVPFFLGFLFVDKGGVIDTAASYNAFKVFSIVLIAITAVGAIIEYYFTRERVTEERFALASRDNSKQGEQKSITTKEQWKICRKDKFWLIIIVFFFLYQLGGMMKNVSQLYFCTSWFKGADGTYSTANGGAFSGTLAIVGAIPTALGMVIAWPLSNKIGKGKAIILGAILSIIGGGIGLLVPFVPENSQFALSIVSFAVKALGTTPAMYLSIALLGDVMDHQEALYGKRTDGLSMTIYGAIMAGMTGIATGILNLILQISNYDPNHPETMQTPMLWIFVGAETICYVLIALLFIFMRVEKYSKCDHKAIEEDQKAVCAARGIPYVSSEERLALEEANSNKEAEEARVKELKAKCEKQGLSFEAEEKKYQDALAIKLKAKQEKEAAAKAKKEEKEKAFADKLAASPELKAKLDAKKAKQEEREKKVGEEFLKLRELTLSEREQALQ